MPKKNTRLAVPEPEVYAPTPGAEPEFDATWDKITDTLASAGEMIDAAESERRRQLTARALGKYSGKTYIAGADPTAILYDDMPDDQTTPPEPDVLTIPAKPTDPYWYDDPTDAMILDHYILARRELGYTMPGALLITGSAGVGKTVSVRKSVERLNDQGHDLRLFKMDCATVTDPGKWFGRREADATGTHFVPSDFWVAVERGDVILLDEIMRLHPHIHNPVMALLDGSEAVNISDLNETLHRHPKTVFIATTNEGTQYGGVHRMDWSMRERFSTTLRRDFPPADEEVRILTTATNCDEDTAALLVEIARKTRDMHLAGDIRNAISTRTLVAAAMWVGFGMREWDALNITAIQEFDGDASGMVGAESDRQKVLGVMEGKLGRGRH
jgi:hypothetical protein